MNQNGARQLPALVAGILLVIASLAAGGCQNAAQTAALGGAGLGALVGGLAGGDATGALIGAGVGTGVGYVIGNEMDKKKAEELTAQMAAQPQYVPPPDPFQGTSWQLISAKPEMEPPIRSLTATFRNDGYVETTRILADGTVQEARESYRVVDNILIVNRPGYIVNATFIIDGITATLQNQDRNAVFKRIGG